MLLLDTVTASAQDLTDGPVDAVTLSAPAAGVAAYRVVFRMTNLDADHAIVARETQGAAVHVNPPQSNGSTAAVVEVERVVTAGEPDVVVSLEDAAGLCTAAAWSAAVCEADRGEPAATESVYTLAITATNGGRIAGATVTVSTDAAGANPVFTGVSDAGGLLRVPLATGSYYMWARHAAYVFDNPRPFTVPEPG